MSILRESYLYHLWAVLCTVYYDSAVHRCLVRMGAWCNRQIDESRVLRVLCREGVAARARNQDRISFDKVWSAVRSIGICNGYTIRSIMYRLCPYIETSFDAFRFEYFEYTIGYVTIHFRHEKPSSFQYCDFTSEASIHGCKFQSDISSPDDDQVFRKHIQIEYRRTGINVLAITKTVNGRNDTCTFRQDEPYQNH